MAGVWGRSVGRTRGRKTEQNWVWRTLNANEFGRCSLHKGKRLLSYWITRNIGILCGTSASKYLGILLSSGPVLVTPGLGLSIFLLITESLQMSFRMLKIRLLLSDWHS